MIIDTHSHCYWDSILPRIDDVVDTMKQHGITHAVQIGCDTKSSIQAIELAKKFPEVFFATVGIHPETSQDMTFQEIDTMMKELEVLISEHRDVIV